MVNHSSRRYYDNELTSRLDEGAAFNNLHRLSINNKSSGILTQPLSIIDNTINSPITPLLQPAASYFKSSRNFHID